MLNGKKTYILAVLAAIIALFQGVGLLQLDSELFIMILAGLLGLEGAALRAGVKKLEK